MDLRELEYSTETILGDEYSKDDSHNSHHHRRRSSEVYTFSGTDLIQHTENVYYRNYAVNDFKEHLRYNLGQHCHTPNPGFHRSPSPDNCAAHPEILEKRQKFLHESPTSQPHLHILEINDNKSSESSKPILTVPISSHHQEQHSESSFFSRLFKPH
jgi:hypothetical protein